MGEFATPVGGSAPPTCPPIRRKKLSKSAIFSKCFGFLPPQKGILPPRCPPQKKEKKKKKLVLPLIVTVKVTLQLCKFIPGYKKVRMNHVYMMASGLWIISQGRKMLWFFPHIKI